MEEFEKKEKDLEKRRKTIFQPVMNPDGADSAHHSLIKQIDEDDD